MKNKKIANSKYRNTGVLFELLVRQITSDTLAGKPHSVAMQIMKKYFNSSTQLGKEMQLYRNFFESSTLTEARALHFIDMTIVQRKKLDDRQLAREKYNLVQEIGATYPLKEFLSCKLPNYIVHASIYKTFASELSERHDVAVVNVREIADARFTLVEHLAGQVVQRKVDHMESAVMSEYRKQPEEMRLLTYKLMIDRFNERYSQGLSDKQKNLLREFIYNVSSTNSLSTYIKNEIPLLKNELNANVARTKDKVTAIKLTEVVSQLDRIGQKREIKDSEIAALMIAYELTKVLSDSGDGK